MGSTDGHQRRAAEAQGDIAAVADREGKLGVGTKCDRAEAFGAAAGDTGIGRLLDGDFRCAGARAGEVDHIRAFIAVVALDGKSRTALTCSAWREPHREGGAARGADGSGGIGGDREVGRIRAANGDQ